MDINFSSSPRCSQFLRVVERFSGDDPLTSMAAASRCRVHDVDSRIRRISRRPRPHWRRFEPGDVVTLPRVYGRRISCAVTLSSFVASSSVPPVSAWVAKKISAERHHSIAHTDLEAVLCSSIPRCSAQMKYSVGFSSPRSTSLKQSVNLAKLLRQVVKLHAWSDEHAACAWQRRLSWSFPGNRTLVNPYRA